MKFRLSTEARQRQCAARPRQHSTSSPYSFLSGGPISIPGQLGPSSPYSFLAAQQHFRGHTPGSQGYRLDLLDLAFEQEETNNVGSREFMETKYESRKNIDYFGKSTGSNRFSYYLSSVDGDFST